MPNWLAALLVGLLLAVIIAIAPTRQDRQPRGWLAWTTDIDVRMVVRIVAIRLSGAVYVAWNGGFSAVAAIDWTKFAFLGLVGATVVVPLILSVDFTQHIARRRVARGEHKVRPHLEYSIVRVIRSITDLSLSAVAGQVVVAVPVGAVGTIVHIHEAPNLPLAYEVEFRNRLDDDGPLGRVQTILHGELEVTSSPGRLGR